MPTGRPTAGLRGLLHVQDRFPGPERLSLIEKGKRLFYEPFFCSSVGCPKFFAGHDRDAVQIFRITAFAYSWNTDCNNWFLHAEVIIGKPWRSSIGALRSTSGI
jgi:hypothetical protein